MIELVIACLKVLDLALRNIISLCEAHRDSTQRDVVYTPSTTTEDTTIEPTRCYCCQRSDISRIVQVNLEVPLCPGHQHTQNLRLPVQGPRRSA